MKTIYNAVIERLQDKVPALKWIDMDMGQLDSSERPAVMWPCVLLTIKIPRAKSITDTLQNCEGQVIVLLAFDTPERTSANAPATNRNAGLAVYDTIADTYAALQGFGTKNFDSLDRTSQGPGTLKNGVFRYPITFNVMFEDATAEAI